MGTENEQSETLKQLAQVRAGGKGEETEDLPSGAGQAAASAESDLVEETPAETETPDGDPVAPVEGEVTETTEEEPIRIGGQTFKTQAEAFAYAEKLENDKLLSDAHAAGVREVLEAQSRANPAAAAEPEDTFDAEFYANPKETLRKIQAQAAAQATEAMKAEVHKEKLWSEFLDEYPDIRRKDAERILLENMNTIGAVKDVAAGKKLLAAKVRSEYAEIENLRKPRTQLSTRKPATTPSGGEASGVTRQKNPEKILSLTEQMRNLRKSN